MIKENFSKTAGVFYLLVTSIVLVFVIGYVYTEDEVNYVNSDCRVFEAEWYQILPNGEKAIIEVPGKAAGQRGEVIVTETVVPDYVSDGKFFCFRNSLQDMQVYIDGKLRHEYTTKDTRLFGKSTENAFIFVPVYEEDAGKTLTVKTMTVSSYSGTMNTVYYGDQLAIWKAFSDKYGMELAIALFMSVLAAITIIFSIVLKFCHKKEIALEYLGWGILLLAIWMISVNEMRQIFSSKISLVACINYLSFMLVLLPFVLYIDHIQNFRYRKIYNFLSALLAFDFVICSALQFLDIVDFTQTLFIMHIVFVTTILGIFLTIILDAKKGFVRSYRLIVIGLVLLIITGLIEVLHIYTNNGKVSSYGICIGLIVLLIMAVIKTAQDISSSESERQRALLADKAKSDFLASMSHEIRTPINAVLGMDEMILRETGEAKIKEYALDIQAAGRTLLTIINDILDLSKIESGKMEIVPVEYDVSSMLYDLANMTRIRAEKKDLKFHTCVSPDIPAKLWGDDVRIKQVLMNLLSNAVKYTQIGAVYFRVRALPPSDAHSAVLHFEVEDTGIGIREEDMDKLFSEFTRIADIQNRNIEGTGLGIPIAMKLLSAMDSKLEVESEFGKGSIFSFDLRQKIVDGTPIGDFESSIRNLTSQQYTYTESFIAPDASVLIVDDNDINRKVFVSLLKETQLRIVEAESGYEAIELAGSQHFDIIFMDHMMPGMDGVNAMKCIKAINDGPCANTPIIVLTANAVAGAKEKYLKDGFDGFLSKPIASDKLESIIRDMLPKEKIKSIPVDKKLPSPVKASGEDFPAVFGVDWEIAMMRLQDANIVRTVLDGFANTLLQQADKLQGFKDALPQSLDDYKIAVHGMKSASGFIGIMPLSGMAAVLEKAAADADTDTIERLHDVFIKEWRSYKDRLGVFTADDASTDKGEISDSELMSILEALSSAMEDLVIDDADDAIRQLSSYTLPEYAAREFEALKAAVAELDQNTAAQIIDRIKKAQCC